MNKRLLGRSGLSVSALGLGTVELGMDYGLKIPDGYGRPSATDAIHIVHEALDNGVNLIDTARAYGESETIIGRALRGRRAQVVLATKVKTQSPDGTPLNGGALAEHMLDHLDASLKLLQTDYVDLWQIHQIDGTLLAQSDIVAAAFAQARAAGKVRAFGGSTYGAEMPLRALASDLFDVLQVGYSVLDQRLADTVFPLAAEKNVGIVARSLLLQGVLTDRGDYLPEPLAMLRERSRQFRRLAAKIEPDTSPAQLALAFGLAQSHIHSRLIGVRTSAELAENLHATEIAIPESLLAELHALRIDDANLLDPRWWEQFLQEPIPSNKDRDTP